MNKVEILLNENNEAILYVNGYELASLGKNKTAQELEVLYYGYRLRQQKNL